MAIYNRNQPKPAQSGDRQNRNRPDRNNPQRNHNRDPQDDAPAAQNFNTRGASESCEPHLRTPSAQTTNRSKPNNTQGKGQSGRAGSSSGKQS